MRTIAPRRSFHAREAQDEEADEGSAVVAVENARRVMPITRPVDAFIVGCSTDMRWMPPDPDATGTPVASDASESRSAPPKRETETTTPRRTLPLSVTTSVFVAVFLTFPPPVAVDAVGLARLRGGGLVLSELDEAFGDVAEEDDAPEDWGGESPEVDEDAYGYVMEVRYGSS